MVADKAFLSFIIAATSCFSFINAARCFSFIVMMAAFFFNPGGVAGTAFFLKAVVFSNPGGSSPPPSPLPRMRNDGGEGERGVERQEARVNASEGVAVLQLDVAA